MNQKCQTTIFSSEQTLNPIINPSVCQKHQKPLSYYNKYKPENDSICIDCLINEIKEGVNPNLYLPISNLEQEYSSQKNTFSQIIEQANNLKKYESYINNFESSLSNYFSKFIAKFIHQKIYDSIPQKKELYQKCNTFTSKDIKNILYSAEKKKFSIDNKAADVFCQIKNMQAIFIKCHDKLEKSFNDLLNDFFGDSNKKQSNEIYNSNVSVPNNSSIKMRDNYPSTQYETKTSKDDDINKISPIDDLKRNIIGKIQEISNFSLVVQKNMNEEKNEHENEKKINHFPNEINNSILESKKSEFDGSNINNSLQKSTLSKFNYSKKTEYKKNSQIIQKICRKCCSSFETTKNEEFCQKCKYISDDEDDERIYKRRTHYFSHKKVKYGFFPKYFNSRKKTYMQTHVRNKKFFGNKNEDFYHRNFGNKSLISSKSNFLNRYGKRINYPRVCKFNNNGKYQMRINYKEHYDKKTFMEKKYYERRTKDEFEVDLETDKEFNTEDRDNYTDINNKSCFEEKNGFFRDNSLKKNKDNNLNKNKNYREEKANDFRENKNNESLYKSEKSEKFPNLENSKDNKRDEDRFKNDNVDNDDDYFECDF